LDSYCYDSPNAQKAQTYLKPLLTHALRFLVVPLLGMTLARPA
jgi:hypothetical protein